MNGLSEKELFRRLKLIRDTRLKYIKKYNIKEDEITFRYDILDKLDEAEYVEVGDSNIRYGKYEKEKTITHYNQIKDILYNRGEVQCYWGDTETVSGNFKKELGYIYVKNEILLEDCSDKRILEIEKKEFEELIDFLKYNLNSDIPYKEKQLEKLQSEIRNIKTRLKELNEIVVR